MLERYRAPALRAALRDRPVVLLHGARRTGKSTLAKQATWSRTQPAVFHFCTHAGREVDLVLEAPSGKPVGVEVKASATVSAGDLRGLRELAQVAGDRFVRGVVLYAGAETIPFVANLHAVPVEALWRW